MTVLPDSEYIVIRALQDAFGDDVHVNVRIPANLFDLVDRSPVVAVYKTGGKAPVTHLVDSSMFAVQTFANDRRLSSRIAREVRAHLKSACDSQYTDGQEGHLAHFREVSGPMAVNSDELTANRPDIYRFVATYMVATKPLTKRSR
ncbi:MULTISPECIES: phage tail termination protein [Streptomyces]